MKKVAFYTLGCKLNYAETSTISRQFEKHNFEKVGFEDGADVYVINTCSVTENADKKCKKLVKEALGFNPQAYVVIVGCYAQLKPQEIANIPGVDAVLGAAEKFALFEHLAEFTKRPKPIVANSPVETANTFYSSWSQGDRTRTFLKVQDGCDYSCSFCTIPLARGGSRSTSIEQIVANAQTVATTTDVKEIVLTGVNIGDYGLENGIREARFFDLVQALDRVEGIERFRISSIEPNLLTNEIIDFVARSNRFVPHFHVPLQSGSNTLLAKMRRRYRRELYADRVSQIKSAMPNACIGVDVIVGFPGETEALFEETYQFLNDLDISYLHVFTYSERANTQAISLDGTVPLSVRSERSKRLHILSEKKRRAFYESQIGTDHQVLFEHEAHGNLMHGFTKNYVKVVAKYDPLRVNTLVSCHLTLINAEGLMEVEELESVYENHPH